MLSTPKVALSALALAVAAQAQSFQIEFNHTGANFLDNWNFYAGVDTNDTGNVLFQDQQAAAQQNLTFLNSAGNYVVKVDNTTSGVGNATFGRPSVKLLSDYTIGPGNLVIMDAVHLPFGCSVWPAFWSQGPVWPDDGEIDIIEGANQQTQNSISLHTLNGCQHPDNASSSSIETGSLVSTDCFNQTNGNQGCIVDAPGASYGQSFAQNGGGAYAMNWNTSGIFVWFFPRASIPSDLATSNPNPNNWGLPTAAYPTSSCDTNTFVKQQTLIIDITICGNFALNVFAQTCSSVASSCLDLVPTPSNYDDAYFEMKYVRVFAQDGTAVASSDSAQAAAASSTQTSNSASATGGSGGSGSGSGSSGASRLAGSLTNYGLFAVFALELVGIYFLTK